jgi:PIN domain nuclease of toxin-antitoxin system
MRLKQYLVYLNQFRHRYFSAASIWEIGIKASLRKKDFPYNPFEVWHLAIETGFSEVPVSSVHGAGVLQLPWHHRDPFDRILVSQAFALPACLYTDDEILPQYSQAMIRRV